MILKNSFEAQQFNDGYSINCSFVNSPNRFPDHWHNFVEIIAPMQEDFEITINSEVYHLKECQIAYVHPGQLHAISSRQKKPCIIVQFDPSLLTRMKNYNDHTLLFNQVGILDEAFCSASGISSLLNILIDIKNQYYSHDHFRELRLCSQLMEFHASLGEFLEKRFYEQKAPADLISFKKHNKQFNKICGYITQNCAQDLTLDQLAEYSGFSKYHFSRLFKEFTNTTFLNFLTTARLGKTMELLSDSTLAITDVAYQSGFGSLTTFNRIFRQYMGCTPSKYRNLLNASNSCLETPSTPAP
ncbi:MAG: AraC family transcriptional regulator [Lachnospiraceae bacterium]|nr:AraC family transcriptional regulator [Lachnospiraceae bacterium]